MLNGCEKGLIDNFRQLGCNGLADKLDTALSSRHVASSELFSVMSSVTEAELLDQKQARADRLLRMAGLKGTYSNLYILEYRSGRNLERSSSTGWLPAHTSTNASMS